MFQHKTMVNDLIKRIRKPDNPGKRVEVINGAMVESPFDTTGTAQIFVQKLQEYLRRNRIGRVVTGMSFRRSNDLSHVLMPDVAYLSFDRTVPISRDTIVPYMPDLVVLIKTPAISTLEIADRSLYYLKNGTSMIWIAHPETQTVDVCSRSFKKNIRIFKVSGESALVAHELLPGLTINLQDVFCRHELA